VVSTSVFNNNIEGLDMFDKEDIVYSQHSDELSLVTDLHFAPIGYVYTLTVLNGAYAGMKVTTTGKTTSLTKVGTLSGGLEPQVQHPGYTSGQTVKAQHMYYSGQQDYIGFGQSIYERFKAGWEKSFPAKTSLKGTCTCGAAKAGDGGMHSSWCDFN
jgi:hypothetical protein